ncbi:DUF4232 domain-containing protein [Rugosimonospora africana]|uniref:DUF4232 domain-containing protein n=1 Tax=Rugosimonospora africana TaxID=556532 RepID=A0A8J3VQH0_9ACTN|nr:DUF4232 domain-containing protein [Rugosimonospora africana]GIH15042.1 hypothetical protein Raf01_32140 [Rugosimonospora africana]
MRAAQRQQGLRRRRSATLTGLAAVTVGVAGLVGSQAGIGLAAASPGVPASSVGPACAASQLVLSGLTSDVADGVVSVQTVVSNSSATACWVAGFPKLVYQGIDGVQATLPTHQTGGIPVRPVVMATGQTASFQLQYVNGYDGHDPSDPACANPGTYQNISLSAGGGGQLPLTGLSIDKKCGDISIYSWRG